MDLTRLNSEFTKYWNTHNKTKAIENLREIDNYLSQGNYNSFLLPYSNLFDVTYLIGRYSIDTEIPVAEVVETISYIDLLEHFRKYLGGLIAESKAIDEEAKKRLEELNKGLFPDLSKVITDTAKNLGSFISFLPIIVLGFVGFLLYKQFAH